MPLELSPIAPAPDIESASERYAQRFSGETGRYFLEVQERAVIALLGPRPRRILEVGGAHAQLTGAFLRAGHEVCVHSSDPSCFERLRPLRQAYPQHLSFACSSFFELPFPDKGFDAVVCIRLMAHVPEWQRLLAELCRVSRNVIIDYPPLRSFNVLYPLLFGLKQRLEQKTTRSFLRFRFRDLSSFLRRQGFGVSGTSREFFLPMGLHRALRWAWLSRTLEAACAGLGLTALLGSPALLAAEEERRG